MGAAIPTIPRLAGLVLAASGATAVGLVDQDLRLVALAASCLWAAAGWRAFGSPGLIAAVTPVAALLTGGWPALVAWSVAGLALSVALRAGAERERLWAARDAVRDAERHRRELDHHIQRYPQLLDACLELSSSRDLDQLAQVLAIRTRDLVDRLRWVRVYLGVGDHPACLASIDGAGNACPDVPGVDERYVAVESRPLIRREADHLKALLPLRGDRRRDDGAEAPRGVLAVCFDPDDLGDRLALELLDALSRLAGIGLAAVDLLQRARGLALRDSLTGLYGQHEFLRRLDEQSSNAQRSRTSLGVLMCDMDRLKAYNDQYGHPAGDSALKAVSAALIAVLPPDALACRYGGEEFAALLPGATRESMASTTEALRAAVEATHPDPANPSRRVTASVGWGLLGIEEAGRDCLKRADEACYRAKAGGRNRVEVAP